MSGCNQRVFDRENAESNAAIAAQYGSELAADFGTRECGQPVVRGGKCEQHKVERRRQWPVDDRRKYRSTDTPTTCGNAICRSELDSDGKPFTKHDTRCEEYGPGWA